MERPNGERREATAVVRRGKSMVWLPDVAAVDAESACLLDAVSLQWRAKSKCVLKRDEGTRRHVIGNGSCPNAALNGVDGRLLQRQKGRGHLGDHRRVMSEQQSRETLTEATEAVKTQAAALVRVCAAGPGRKEKTVISPESPRARMTAS